MRRGVYCSFNPIQLILVIVTSNLVLSFCQRSKSVRFGHSFHTLSDSVMKRPIKALIITLLFGGLGSFSSCQKEKGPVVPSVAANPSQNDTNCPLVTRTIHFSFPGGPGVDLVYHAYDCAPSSGNLPNMPNAPAAYDDGAMAPGGFQVSDPPYEHINTALVLTSGASFTAPQSYNCAVLRSAPETRRLLGSFVQNNVDNPRSECVKQRGWYDRWFDGAVHFPKGPVERYVRDPLNSGVAIDLQRMLVLGNWPLDMVTSTEIMTAVTTADGYYGYNDRDFYSMQLGHDFYVNYANQLAGNPNNFAQLVSDFLNDPTQRTVYTSPTLCR